MAETVSFFIKISDKGTFKKVEVDADSLRDAVRHVKEEADRLNNGVVNWAQASQAIDLMQQSFNQLSGVVADLSGAYAQQEVAEAKLANNMRNTMGARDEDIQSIKDLCSAQQRLGVIGDEVQLSGAQELATYLEKKSSLERLIPVMNDMLAQQYGLNATQESAAQIATMLGKVMDGQVGALSRYGYKFDDAQEQILKFGTEEERAAVLAEVVESAVGGMNAELAKTESGKQKQLANTLGDVKEQLGALAQDIAPIVTIGSQLVILAAGAAKAVTTMKALASAMGLASVKGKLLAAHTQMVAAAQRLLGVSSVTAATGTWALNAAVAALYATLTMGISLVISGIVALFSKLGHKAGEASGEIDSLKESADAFANATSNAKAEIDMEVASLRALINSNGNTAKKIEELNNKYGEAFGYHRTAAEWYETLMTKSRAYCQQLGYEAQAKVLASQIAAKELERDALQSQKEKYDGAWRDAKGRTHAGWEKMDGGLKAYVSLREQLTKTNDELTALQTQYDTCIKKMTSARQEMEQQALTATLSGKRIEINSMTYEELKRAIDENSSSLEKLDPNEKAEISRLTTLNEQLTKRKKVLGELLGLEKPTKNKGSDEEPPADPKTYAELGAAISAYEKRLKKTHPSEQETIRLLSAEIAQYKEKQLAIEQQWHEASRPAELNTLQAIDAELRYQQNLRSRATEENVAGIDKEIARLNDLRRKFEEGSHVILSVEQIDTYEQLEGELAYYEHKLSHATATERVEIQKQINVLNELRAQWDDTLDALEVPEDISRLSTINELEKAITYYSARQKKSNGEEKTSIQRTIDALEAKRDALQRLTELPSMQRELTDLSGLSGKKLTMELELVGLEGIKGKIRSLQKMLEDTQNPLAEAQRKEVQQMISAWEDYERQLKKSQMNLRDAWNGIKGIGNGVENITDALKDNGSAWEKVTGVIDGVLSIYDGLSSVIQLVELLTAASSAHTAAKTAEAAAEATEAGTMVASSTAESAASVATAAVLGVETAKWSALAAAKTFAAHAEIPFAGTAIASGFVTTQQSVILASSIPKFANGAVAYGPTLGIFGEYAGASRNPEVVAPLDKLKGLLGDVSVTGGMRGKVNFRIKGRYLEGVMEKEHKLKVRG